MPGWTARDRVQEGHGMAGELRFEGTVAADAAEGLAEMIVGTGELPNEEALKGAGKLVSGKPHHRRDGQSE